VAVWLQANIHNTEALLKEAMPWMNRQARVSFLVPAGMGVPWIQRIRVKISRIRKKLESRGKKYRHFNLRSTIHPYTHEGIRYDCVTMWTTQNATQESIELLEEMLGV
jgi:hypothetical protein